MRTALTLALTLTALGSGVHGAAHTQCQDGTAPATGGSGARGTSGGWNIEYCPAGVTESFTPSVQG